MNLGIVGHAADKFTTVTTAFARQAIVRWLTERRPAKVVSGRSPLGGVDVWAEELAAAHGIPTLIFPPAVNAWDAPGGFKDRNLQIAAASDLVLVIVVAQLPAGFRGRRFTGCYHCLGRNPPHVKSGGCWTAWRAKAQAWEIIDIDRASQAAQP